MKSFIEENDLAWIELDQYIISGTVKKISNEGIIIQTASDETEAVSSDTIIRMHSIHKEPFEIITKYPYEEFIDIDGFFSSDTNKAIPIGHLLTKKPGYPDSIPPTWNDNIKLWFHSSGGKCPCGCGGGLSSSADSLQK
ncbi:hypothetical protein [Pseudomonas sp. UV AK001]|uniref:hypothetical protein n=1 Tax=Pseudomonas sp. UV AK001 TaxID=3384791 RepID=UPI0038D42EDD